MNLSEQQKAAVQRARKHLETKRSGLLDGQPQEPAFWAGWLDQALATLLRELEDGDDEEPVPSRVMDAFRQHVGGFCTCGGHVDRGGVFHAAGVA